jgi:predicted N-acetyltransferase YhbS
MGFLAQNVALGLIMWYKKGVMAEFKIRKIEEKDIAGTAKVFSEAFNFADKEEGWNTETACEYVKYWMKRKPDLFFIVERGHEIVGGIAGDIKPFKGDITLTEVVLFVSPKYHKQGIAKKLVKEIIEESVEKYDVSTVDGIANSEVKFPMGWYERLGFKQTKWVYIEGKAEELLKNLESAS